MKVMLNEEQVQRLQKLYTGYMGETQEQFANRVFNIGLTQIEYRRDNNVKQREERKELRQLKQQLEQHPELRQQLK